MLIKNKNLFRFKKGVSWIGIGIGIVTTLNKNVEFDGLIGFFSIINALQGIFIFIHFIITIQLILNSKLRTSIKSLKILNLFKQTSTNSFGSYVDYEK